MASPKALQEWCRLTCAHYPDVEIKNMSTSFRDGLAFCAIIHKHRPDLIDFSSLSKDNVYLNNKLAFEIAETKLGIPALLDPNDMVSHKVPDCLSVITYISQHYYFFNRKSYAGLASLKSPHVTILNNLTKSKTPDGLKSQRSSTDLETRREDHLSNTRPRTVCNLCFKPVHLIQRHLIDGKVCHRSCFRCKVCHSTLLPGSYTQGSDAGSLICSHHITDSTCVAFSQQIRSAENQPKCNFQPGYLSLGGLPVTSFPQYTNTTESQDRLRGRERQERSREVKDRENRGDTVALKDITKKPAPPHLPPPTTEDRAVEGTGNAGPILLDSPIQQEGTKCRESSELSSPCAQRREGSSRPVPAPRRMVDASTVPVPAPRTKMSQTTSSSSAAGSSTNQNKCSPHSPHVTSPTTGSPKVKSNHPWLAIVHPGPWTQLPPAPPPVPTPRSKSVSNLQGSWYRPKVPPPNPFGEDVEEDATSESADQTKPSVAAICSGNGDNLRDKSVDTDAAVCLSDAAAKYISADYVKPPGKPIPPVLKEDGGVEVPVAAEGVGADNNTVGASSEPAGDTTDLDETGNMLKSHILPKSLSVPVITSASCQSSPLPSDLTANEPGASCQSKLACKENPFDRKPQMPKSKTFQALSSGRAPAPGHGFPLIKRKVQTDQSLSAEDLQIEMRELDKHLEALEQKGVELERNLRDCKNDKAEEQMLMEWFSLVHERHVLVRRDAELVFLIKQQKLEETQADVEFELRCLLNKPESEWTQEDRDREKQMMKELVAIIEQRNQIISSLDQDRQREREEDMLLEDMKKSKEFQREGLKELKKSKGKFKPTQVFLKILNHKTESTKDSVDKKELK